MHNSWLCRIVGQIRQSSARSDQLRYLKHLKCSLKSFLFLLGCVFHLAHLSKKFYSKSVYLGIIVVDTLQFAKNSYLLSAKIQSFAPRFEQVLNCLCSLLRIIFCLLFRSILSNITKIDKQILQIKRCLYRHMSSININKLFAISLQLRWMMLNSIMLFLKVQATF